MKIYVLKLNIKNTELLQITCLKDTLHLPAKLRTCAKAKVTFTKKLNSI